MEQFTVTHLAGALIIEGKPGSNGSSAGIGARELVELCLNTRARAALLYAEQLPAAFFDLSSGVAGDFLQKLRSYGGIRLAVISPTNLLRPSSRFADMEGEAKRTGSFGLFRHSDDARTWLTKQLSAAPRTA